MLAKRKRIAINGSAAAGLSKSIQFKYLMASIFQGEGLDPEAAASRASEACG
jgi:hypothetical protein